jgi:hypothetical protein
MTIDLIKSIIEQATLDRLGRCGCDAGAHGLNIAPDWPAARQEIRTSNDLEQRNDS